MSLGFLRDATGFESRRMELELELLWASGHHMALSCLGMERAQGMERKQIPVTLFERLDPATPEVSAH